MKALAIIAALAATPAAADSFTVWQHDQWTVEYLDTSCALTGLDMSSSMRFLLLGEENDIFSFILEVPAGSGAQDVINITTARPRYLNHDMRIDGQVWRLDIDGAFWGDNPGTLVIASIGTSYDFRAAIAHGRWMSGYGGLLFDLTGSAEALSVLEACRQKLGTW